MLKALPSPLGSLRGREARPPSCGSLLDGWKEIRYTCDPESQEVNRILSKQVPQGERGEEEVVATGGGAGGGAVGREGGKGSPKDTHCETQGGDLLGSTWD